MSEEEFKKYFERSYQSGYSQAIKDVVEVLEKKIEKFYPNDDDYIDSSDMHSIATLKSLLTQINNLKNKNDDNGNNIEN